MSNPRLVIEVARWEFGRFFKLKDLVATLVVLAIIVGVVLGVGWLMLRDAGERVRVAVTNASLLSLNASPDPGFEFISSQGGDEAALLDAVEREELDGLLIIRSLDEAELVVSGDPLWQGRLTEMLTDARRRARLAGAKLSPREVDDLLMAFKVEVTYHRKDSQASTTMERIYAAGFMGVVLIAVAACYMYQFTAITGEKHLHVTEQIVSAISPQVWMDGKILGISLLGLVTVLIYGGLAFGVSVLVLWFYGLDFIHLLWLARPSLIFLLLVLALLGILFWNCFFAAIAATIDDPNSSSRSVYMFLSFLPVTVAGVAITKPDTLLMKALGMFPVTSPAVLSVRLVRTDVAGWEILVAVLLLVASIWLLRRAAGKIFRVAMLIHGKEPSLSEIGRWLKEA